MFTALSARVGSIGDSRLGGWYAYRASESALNQILRTLAIEVARSRPEAIIVGLLRARSPPAFRGPSPDPTADGVFSPEESAAHLLRMLNGLGVDGTGGVFAWDGSPIPA